MRNIIIVFLILLPLGLVGCAHTDRNSTAFEGSVIYVMVEDGFYGIRTSDGQRLDPLNLPEELKKDGLKIEGRYIEKQGMSSIRMWGRIVELVSVNERK